MKRCNAVILLFLLFGAASVSAATFTHPDAGYTVWYPDGWYVHKEPEALWVTRKGGLWGPFEFHRQRLTGEHGGFVASTCPENAYVELNLLGAPAGTKVLPENHAEVLVMRGAEDVRCAAWLDKLPDHAPVDPEAMLTVKVDGATLPLVQLAQVFTTYPVVKAFVCRELGGRAYLFRLTVAGMEVDYAFLRSQLERMVRSLSVSVKEGTK
mgnify:CR=1 FL=1